MIGTAESSLAEPLPARMLNEVTYCPRLFYYEHVEGVFAHNQETVEGSLRHSQLDAREEDCRRRKAGRNRPARPIAERDAVQRHARRDRQDGPDRSGRPAGDAGGLQAWPARATAADGSIAAWDADRVQLAVQALILRDMAISATRRSSTTSATKQRVRVPIDAPLVGPDAGGDRAGPRDRGRRAGSRRRWRTAPSAPAARWWASACPTRPNLLCDWPDGAARASSGRCSTSSRRATRAGRRADGCATRRCGGWCPPATTCGRCT